MEKDIIIKVLNPGIINQNCIVIPAETAIKIIEEMMKEKFEDTTNEEQLY